jgi:hypothetical protein
MHLTSRASKSAMGTTKQGGVQRCAVLVGTISVSADFQFTPLRILKTPTLHFTLHVTTCAKAGVRAIFCNMQEQAIVKQFPDNVQCIYYG